MIQSKLFESAQIMEIDYGECNYWNKNEKQLLVDCINIFYLFPQLYWFKM